MVESRAVVTNRGRVSYSETGQGPPLVVFHSLLTDGRAFDRVAPELPRRVITVDLPGFGETDRAGSIEGFADLMAGAVEAACDEPATVLGNGLGSFVALALAIRHPELVRRLILVGAGATFPAEARPAFTRMAELAGTGGMESVVPVALRRIFTEDYLAGHPEEGEERARVLAATDPEAFIAACHALEVVDLTDGAATVGVPVLIVVGADDEATPPAMAEQLGGLLPDSNIVTIPGVAHAPQLQDPQAFIEAIARFLEGE